MCVCVCVRGIAKGWADSVTISISKDHGESLYKSVSQSLSPASHTPQLVLILPFSLPEIAVCVCVYVSVWRGAVGCVCVCGRGGVMRLLPLEMGLPPDNHKATTALWTLEVEDTRRNTHRNAHIHTEG